MTEKHRLGQALTKSDRLNKDTRFPLFPEISLYYFYFFIRMVGAKTGEVTLFILVGS